MVKRCTIGRCIIWWIFMVPRIYFLHEMIDPVVRRWYILSIGYQCIPEYELFSWRVCHPRKIVGFFFFLFFVFNYFVMTGELINKWKYISSYFRKWYFQGIYLNRLTVGYKSYFWDTAKKFCLFVTLFVYFLFFSFGPKFLTRVQKIFSNKNHQTFAKAIQINVRYLGTYRDCFLTLCYSFFIIIIYLIIFYQFLTFENFDQKKKSKSLSGKHFSYWAQKCQNYLKNTILVKHQTILKDFLRYYLSKNVSFHILCFIWSYNRNY